MELFLVRLFEFFCLSVCCYYFYKYARASKAAGRVEPELALCFGLLFLGFLEAPWDWALHCTFSDHFVKLPEVWPFVTYGGLPFVAFFGYVSWFMTSAIMVLWIARKLVSRTGWNATWTVIGTGYALGFAWDAGLNVPLTWAGIWRYSYLPDGLVYFPETFHQYSVVYSFLFGSITMTCSYLMFRAQEGRGVFVESRLISTVSSPRARGVRLIAVTIGLLYAMYLTGYIPTITTKVAGLHKVAAQTRDGIPSQPF